MNVTIYEYSVKDGKLQKTAHAAVKRENTHGVVYIYKKRTQPQYVRNKNFEVILHNRIFAHVEDDEKYRKMFQEHYKEKVREAEEKLQQYKDILERLEE